MDSRGFVYAWYSNPTGHRRSNRLAPHIVLKFVYDSFATGWLEPISEDVDRTSEPNRLYASGKWM
jgi:hypothetical protein